MNWLTNYVRPKLRALVGRDIPDHLWDKCPKCEQMIFHRDLEENLRVCRHCQHHLRLDPKSRLKMIYDHGVYQRITIPKAAVDPLGFRDQKKYGDRLKDARLKTNEEDAVVVAKGEIGGYKVVTAVFNFSFMGGSMGGAVGNALLAGSQVAVAERAAFMVISASGGARMQEGIISLMQMPRTTIAVSLVREAGLPYFTLLTDPTLGGVTASFAMLGDVCLSEPGAMIGFAGRRVIEQTIKQELPVDFQTAEYLLQHGMVDMVVSRHDLKKRLTTLLSLLMKVPALTAA